MQVHVKLVTNTNTPYTVIGTRDEGQFDCSL